MFPTKKICSFRIIQDPVRLYSNQNERRKSSVLTTTFIVVLAAGIGFIGGVVSTMLLRAFNARNPDRIEEFVVLATGSLVLILGFLQSVGLVDSENRYLDYEFWLPIFLGLLGVFLVLKLKGISRDAAVLRNVTGEIRTIRKLCEAVTEDEQLIRRVAAATSISVTRWDAGSTAFKRLTTILGSAEKRIRQIAIARTPALPPEVFDSYMDVLTRKAQDPSMGYTYILGDNYPQREQRLCDVRAKSIGFELFVFADADNQLPALNFAVVDDKIVFVRYPHDTGTSQLYLELCNPDVAELFTKYHDMMLKKASRLP